MDPKVIKWAVDNGISHEKFGTAQGRAEVLDAYNLAHNIGTRNKKKKMVRVLVTAADGSFHDLGTMENRKKGIGASVFAFLCANNLPFDAQDIAETEVYVAEVASAKDLLSES